MADPRGFATFDSPIGACGIAWSGAGIARVMLPGARRAGPEADPPAPIRRAIERIAALLHGARDDLADLALDWDGIEPFERRVYVAARAIGPGHTRTYGEVAASIGEPGAARAVGRALGANRFAIVVPCHRVLAAGGRSGGFSAPGGVDTKRRLLEIEHARIGSEPSLF